MTRISFAISVLIFFNPFTNLWERIADQTLNIRTSLFGLTLHLNIPFMGALLLILYFILCWVILALLLWGLEESFMTIKTFQKLGPGLRFFRNRILHAGLPGFLYWPEILARYVFWFLVIKFVLVEIMRVLLLTALPGMISGWINSLAGTTGFDLTSLLTNWITALVGSHTSQNVEVMLVVLSFLIIQIKRYHFMEKDYRHFDDIKSIQRKRHTSLERGA